MNYSEIISQWQKKISNYQGIKRDFQPIQPLWSLHKIITILWWRRVGKTRTLMQLMQEAINLKLCSLDQIIFIDFSELNNNNISLENLHTYIQQLGIHHPIYCFDEVQELQDFDRQLTFIYNQTSKLFITGSNSKLLSQDLATILRGRTYELHQTPLSFNEFLRFRGFPSIPNEIILNTLFDEFVKWWWFPEVVLTPDETVKSWILNWYLEILIFKDLVDRYRIRNQSILQSFVQSLILSHTKELNVNKLFLTYKSQWYDLSKNTLYEYLEYIKHTFLVDNLGQFYKKTLFEKYYLIDNGFLTCISDKDNRGQKFESTIYHHLQKQHKNLWFVKDDFEIDFTDWKTNWQACRQLNEENRFRESAFKNAKQHNLLITRFDHKFQDKKIKMLNWKELFSLENTPTNP